MALCVSSPASRDEWNTILTRLPGPHFLQTWEWGALKSRYGWEPTRFVWSGSEKNEPLGIASVLTRRLGRWPSAVMYTPKGPILEYGESDLLEQILERLEGLATDKHALFIKIDPDVQVDTPEGEAVMAVLRSRGWRFSREQIQFRNTMLVDLGLSPDELLAAMKSKWRYNTRLAVRKGVVVHRSGPDDLPLLYRLYAETSTRDGFVIRSQEYYLDAWGSFMRAGLAQPLIAEVEGEPVAMVILFRCGHVAWYVYGASRSVHREKMPNHLLQWEAMRWAQEQGCTVYDMWGAPEVLDDSDPLWGVYRFKQGFGGQLVRYIGAWDYPVSRLGYWLYAKVMPQVLAMMRWRHWQRSASGH
jgi:peptidoglycan pentaglycine glycine transferase (the first glycine)